VEVCAADAGVRDADEDVVDADFGFGKVLELEASGTLGLDEGFHSVDLPLGMCILFDGKRCGKNVFGVWADQPAA
jgi:hypothetical protein